MKPIRWHGRSLEAVREFSEDARRDAGYQLRRLQVGHEPDDYKPMPSVGAGVFEVRIHAESEYRVIYVAKLADAIHVLHAFKKKTQRTARIDLDVTKARYRELKRVN